MVEIDTGVCDSAAEARRDLDAAVSDLRTACEAEGVTLAGAGSHPFALHRQRLVYPAERYERLIDRNQWVARRLMVFGLHVHLGMPGGERAGQVSNGLLWHLPHMLALSASSPFWQRSDTGLASSRITIFEALPTAGHPCTFDDWAEFQRLYDAMMAARAIGSVKDIWWDLRPHPDYGTVEIRVCDALPTINETVALVAFAHALAARLLAEAESGRTMPPPPYWVLRENKWRASRWGMDAELVLDARGRCAPVKGEIEKLCAQLEPIAARQGAGAEFAGLAALVARPSYVRQRAVFGPEGSYETVARLLVDEFAQDRPLG
jgi:carboxylate-amine ligase